MAKSEIQKVNEWRAWRRDPSGPEPAPPEITGPPLLLRPAPRRAPSESEILTGPLGDAIRAARRDLMRRPVAPAEAMDSTDRVDEDDGPPVGKYWHDSIPALEADRWRLPRNREQRREYEVRVTASPYVTRRRAVVLKVIAAHLGTNGDCFPTQVLIAQLADCCERTVRYAITRARDLGLLNWVHRIRWRADAAGWVQTSNLYRLLPLVLPEQSRKKDSYKAGPLPANVDAALQQLARAMARR